MSDQRNVRVRFAPSPTGGLHLGGVRTALFNYLFARKYNGRFILRIEDTDQSRFVPGAEAYINECLEWCGIVPDESPDKGGEFGPYRQSERKERYRSFAEQLIREGHAYYAFDTPEELERARKEHSNFRYDFESRKSLHNSLNLTEREVADRLASGVPHVVRMKISPGQIISFHDMIRGQVVFESDQLDDKVLLKADGMPTYHLAVVVDDYQMKISHVFRGEEWLPSAPVHVLLWEYLGWKNVIPEWAHLPLILKPDGNGKLSKRDGERLGFPVFALNWQDPATGQISKGYRELGFLPEAFINMLVSLGWNPGGEKELFSMEEMIGAFSVERISKAGAKFSFEKAKWYNHEWVKRQSAPELIPFVRSVLLKHGVDEIDIRLTEEVIDLVRERLILLTDFWSQAGFFFQKPREYDVGKVKSKWNIDKTMFFNDLIEQWAGFDPWSAENLEHYFKLAIQASGMKAGELLLPFRIMLVGGRFGPDVFQISAILGRQETIQRIKNGLTAITEGI